MSHPHQALLTAIKAQLPELEALRERVEDHWGCEDGVYRFYHQSFKVYGLQELTRAIAAALRRLSPAGELDGWFLEIVEQGTGRTFSYEVNQRWSAETRPIVEACFHARYFLDMVCRYGRELEAPPDLLPSGWAAVLCLYRLR